MKCKNNKERKIDQHYLNSVKYVKEAARWLIIKYDLDASQMTFQYACETFLVSSQKLYYIKLEKTALYQGWTDHISMTHDLDPDLRSSIPCELWSWSTHTQKFKDNSQSVPKIKWKQMDGGM